MANETKRPIGTLAEALRIIEALRKENKSLRQNKNHEKQRTDVFVQRIQQLEQQLAAYQQQQ